MHDARMLADAVAGGRCVVLTGAGMSTESGIPDFRSAGGVWQDVDPFEVASIDAFRRDPARVWEFYARRLQTLAGAAPNAGHYALAELERRALVDAVVTQNVDGLHAAAGSQTVVELHGSLATAVCLACGTEVGRSQLEELLPLPQCPRCGAVLKPGVVMFGELLPAGALALATELAETCRLLLVVGSSLEVYPAAGLPDVALAAGATLAIVNREPTPYDERADLVLHASAGEVLAALV